MNFTAQIRKTDGTTRIINNIEYIFKSEEEIYLALKEELTEYGKLYRPIRILRLNEISNIIIIDEFNFEFYKEDWGL